MAKQYDNTNLLREILEGEPLTEREVEVLQLTAHGLSSIEIGEKLHLSPETVKGYKKRMIYKLDVKNSCHAVAVGIALGIVNIEEFVKIDD